MSRTLKQLLHREAEIRLWSHIPANCFAHIAPSTNSLWGESVGEGGGSTSNRGAGVLHAGVQTPLAAPYLPLREEVWGTIPLS